MSAISMLQERTIMIDQSGSALCSMKRTATAAHASVAIRATDFRVS
jgi:hypothetical protein